MEVLDAVDVVGGVHGEGDAVQAALAHHTGEALGVVGLACGPQDTLHDGLTADVTGLQGVLLTHTHTHTQIHTHKFIGAMKSVIQLTEFSSPSSHGYPI